MKTARKLICLLVVLCMVVPMLLISVQAADATITFDNASKRTVGTTTQQVWEENGIKVTNDQAGSSSDVNFSSINPVRFYKYSSVTVEYTQKMSQIIFHCSGGSKYTLSTCTIPGATVSGDEATVIVTLDTPATSFNIPNLNGNQVRLTKIEVVAATGGEGGGSTPEPDPTPVAPTDPKEIVDAAYALAEGDSMSEEVSLTGKVTKIDTPYSEQWNNISVTIEIPGAEDKPILCYRLGGEEVAQIAVGDTITVTGTIKNHYGTIEFGQGCSLDDRIPGEGVAPVAPSDPKQIVDEAFALDKGASLPYEASLTGKITEIVTAYSEDYKNITVNIEVEGTSGKKTIECYRMKGEGAENLAVGDMITVTGQLTRYYKAATEEKPELDKIEFNSGCTFVLATGDDNTGDDNTGDVTAPESAKEILDAAYALEAGASLPYEATLTGKVVSIDTEYSEQYDNITVTIVVEGCEDQPIQCFRLKGNGADELLVDDVITVTGNIINYNGKVQFNAGSTFIYGDGEQSPVTADVTMIVFVVLAVLCGTTAVVLVSKKKMI